MNDMDTLISALRAALGDDSVIEGTRLAERARSFWDPRPLEGRALLLPRDTAAVSTALRLCHEARQPVIPLGGGTNIANATASGADDVLISLERLRGIGPVDLAQQTVTVDAGALLEAVQEQVSAAGLKVPVDLGARGSCTIGGMIACNAGGNQVLRYGMTRDMVLGLEAVLADGTVLSGLTPYLKNNTGYDLKQWFVGSEGTLGIVTRAVLRLYPAPRSRHTALLAVDDFAATAPLLLRLRARLGGLLTSFEGMWQSFYELNSGEHSTAAPIFDTAPAWSVLVEIEGQDAEADGALFEQVLGEAWEAGGLADAVIAGSEADRLAMWAIREGCEAEAKLYTRTDQFDISLAMDAMLPCTEAVRTALAEQAPDSDLHVFGHLGDGNLHLVVGHRHDEVDSARVKQLIYGQVAEWRGSVSAEHGIGLDKKAYLPLSRSAAEIAAMRAIKLALDPHGILNPGKIFDL